MGSFNPIKTVKNLASNPLSIVAPVTAPFTAAYDMYNQLTGSPTGEIPAASGTGAEQELMATIKNILDQSVKDSNTMWPIILANAGYKLDDKGNAVKMSEEESLASMSPLDKQNYLRQKALGEREQLALEGKLPLPVGTQQQMDEQRRMNESLLAQKLGTDWQTSTSGIQSQSRQQANELAATDAFRRGEVSLGMGLLGQNQALMQSQNAATNGVLSGYGGRNLNTISGYNAALQPYENDKDRATQLAIGQMEAKAAERAGLYGLLGTGLGLAGGIAMCWVAREVYGADNPKWLVFRSWLENKAPKWFHDLYVKYGERFSKFIHNKPMLKYFIRLWMDSRIAEVKHALSF